MDIGKLYETLTGEPYPHSPAAFVDASWGVSTRASLLQGLQHADEQAQAPAEPTVRRSRGWRGKSAR